MAPPHPAPQLFRKWMAQKVRPAASDREIEARLVTLRPMREAMLQQLEVFATLGKLDKKVPAVIRKGKGSLDTAQDAVAIAGVFDEHGGFGGKHPFSPEQIDQLRADGDWLVNVLKPQGVKGARVARDPAAILRPTSDRPTLLLPPRIRPFPLQRRVEVDSRSLRAAAPPKPAVRMSCRCEGRRRCLLQSR